MSEGTNEQGWTEDTIPCAFEPRSKAENLLRSRGEVKKGSACGSMLASAAVTQLVECPAVNRYVAGSSPVGGVTVSLFTNENLW